VSYGSTESVGWTGTAPPSLGFETRKRRRWHNAEALIGAPRAEWPAGLRRLRQIGLALIGLQFLAFCIWSAILVHRVALTHDFMTYEQAVYLISRGHLDPFSSSLGYPFWQDHGTFLLWPLAFLDWLWPHPVTLLWIQDALTVAAEAVALVWACEIASTHVRRVKDERLVWACVSVALLILLINPWISWAVSADFHTEPLAMVWIVAAARDLFADRKRMWLWAVLAMLSGDVGASCCAALGVSAIIAGQRWWRTGLALTLAGAFWMLALGAVHATKGTQPGFFAPLLLGHTGHVPSSTSSLEILQAIVRHPDRAVHAFGANILNVWANLSAGGLLGLLWPPTMVPIALVLLESALAHGPRFSDPGVQNLPVYILGAVGTTAVCLKLARSSLQRRSRWMMPTILGLLAMNAIGWAVVWLPQLPKTWLRVDSRPAATLGHLATRVGPHDQVIVQAGVSTGFDRRLFIHPTFKLPSTFTAQTRHLWLVFAPAQGIEEASPSDIYGAMTKLAGVPHMRLALAMNGIWAFEWTPPQGVHRLTVAVPSPNVIGAWTVPGTAGTSVRRGPVRSWHTISNGREGYVVSGDYWLAPPGPVSADVSLDASGPTNVELWDNTAGTLLARKRVSHSNGTRGVHLTGKVTRHKSNVYGGWGPWQIKPTSPAPGDVLEIRVWTPGHGKVTVDSLTLRSRGATDTTG
jgi:hypothetical protein